MLMMVLCDREGRIYDVWISFGSMHEVKIIILKTLGEKLDLKFTPPVITISNSISIKTNTSTQVKVLHPLPALKSYI